MKRLAVIKKDKCNPEGCGHFLCMRYCPINRKGDECIFKADDHKAGILEELCIGCMICVNKCPFGAIDVINLPAEFDTEPIHRYGENKFVLFSLPTPVPGKVVGIIGKNGIGKSTAINILVGVEKPNLGKDKEVGFDDLLNYFKGTQAQRFFEKVRDGKIKVAYKPQHVDMIPKTAKGSVRLLLEKVNETGKLQEIVEALSLNKVLETNINNVSGGELQRIAIAATVLKKANLYIFDEPTSYLDIKQRLKVAQLIRSLVEDGETSVLVIEHDLISLDYMTDLVHIMYGKSGSFGVVSLPKSTKEGINAYLAGYLKDQNIRFRDSKIVFDIKAALDTKTRMVLTSWPELDKKMGKFSLKTEAGELHKQLVVGVLGENGIGKTSFVKLLAGVEKPDHGNIDTEVAVSYKPQYLDNDSDELVQSILGDAIEKYKTELIDPLEIEPLLLKQINQLSGGELQRVAIAAAMSRKAHLILLDEPSAYLDVEQRLAVSKMIRYFVEAKGISVLVVDHDLLFLDYASDKLLVFDGEPAVAGKVAGPFAMERGMNDLLTNLGISLRRDELSHRPRINKIGSYKDREQKKTGKLYYA
ncbi:ribosome biogenesis/translation initiation ATPase RLI [Candidatus Woesearchaeota archaeon CG10_big_fil_rev_8_21_14_0_10_34_8]|nr:MAG: ribosome biogenesis/translation initiation ATPase RLI [Candidatus Woesearchaeota archaeon CG10_big_fil_rev_8_21_14_0_10_34_8]